MADSEPSQRPVPVAPMVVEIGAWRAKTDATGTVRCAESEFAIRGSWRRLGVWSHEGAGQNTEGRSAQVATQDFLDNGRGKRCLCYSTS